MCWRSAGSLAGKGSSPRHSERRAGGCEGAKESQNAKTVAQAMFS